MAKRILLIAFLFVTGFATAQAQYVAPYTGAVTRTNNSKMADVVSVFDFIPVSLQAGIKARTYTTDISGYIRSAATGAAGNTTLFFPCGTYWISSSITLPSNTRIVGAAGNCAVIKESASMALNAAWGALWPDNTGRMLFINSDLAGGNTNIAIKNIEFDMTLAPSGVNTHAFLCNNCTQVEVDGNTFIGEGGWAGDGVAMVGSNDYTVRNNYVSNVANACYDQWGGSSNGDVSNNTCDTVTGAHGAGGLGIVVTGVNTDNSAATSSSNIKITRNKIFRTDQDAIWVQGGYGSVGPIIGSVSDVLVANNDVDTVTTFHGIRVSDGFRVTIVNNHVRNTKQAGILLQAEGAGGTDCSFCTISGNTFTNINTGSNADIAGAAIGISTASTQIVVIGNDVDASPTVPLFISAGSTLVSGVGNQFPTGTSGFSVFDNGANHVCYTVAGVNKCKSGSTTTSSLTPAGQLTVQSEVLATSTAHGLLIGEAALSVVSMAAMTDGQIVVGQSSADPLPKTVGGDATMAASGALTLASVISAGGPTGSATVAPIITWDAKGRLTVVSSATITPAIGSITGLGTGVATALGVNVGTAGALVVNGGALGSPSSAGTMPAFTLGGAISGGGNQIDNVVIGTSTPLAAKFAAADNVNAIFMSGASAGFRAYGTGSIGVIEGINTANNAYRQLNLGGSEVHLLTSGADKVVVTSASTDVKNLLINSGIGSAAQTNVACVSGAGLFTTQAWTTGCAVSSARFKRDRARIDDADAYRIVTKLISESFYYKEDTNLDQDRHFGFMAEQVEGVDPELVTYESDGKPHAVKYQELSPFFAGAFRYMQKEITELHQRLKADNDNMRTCVDDWKCRIFGWRDK